MKTFSIKAALGLAVLVPLACWSQVNSGSNGSDGAFNPTTNTVINMADHPDGVYHYTAVNISNGVTVTFIPNPNNTPVVWLVQSNCVIDGSVNVSAYPEGSHYYDTRQEGGPGGARGGNGGATAGGGMGLGGGSAGWFGGNGSFGTAGERYSLSVTQNQAIAGSIYGNSFLMPLLGGSGGGGTINGGFGGGGGGAILIAASGTIQLNGIISASGANGGNIYFGDYGPSVGGGGAGSGGAVRLLVTRISGYGSISAIGGITSSSSFWGWNQLNRAGQGRVRLDVMENNFNGSISGAFSQGSQFIVFPTGQAAQLTVTSAGGVPVSASPTGQLAIPDAVLSSQQTTPIPVVVKCSNLPLNTAITVSVKPANGATISAVGYNNAGTVSNSTATVMINIPRGGGIIYATAATLN